MSAFTNDGEYLSVLYELIERQAGSTGSTSSTAPTPTNQAAPASRSPTPPPPLPRSPPRSSLFCCSPCRPPGLPLDLADLSCPLVRSSLLLRSLYLTQSYLLPAPLYSTAASGTSASGTINTWFSSAASNLQAIRWRAVGVRTQILR